MEDASTSKVAAKLAGLVSTTASEFKLSKTSSGQMAVISRLNRLVDLANPTRACLEVWRPPSQIRARTTPKKTRPCQVAKPQSLKPRSGRRLGTPLPSCRPTDVETSTDRRVGTSKVAESHCATMPVSKVAPLTSTITSFTSMR